MSSTPSARSERSERYERNETEAQRLDRNYGELLQELRVAQTGVQILFAFMLGIAFQQRFGGIDEFQRIVYLVSLLSSAIASATLIAPVALHRVLFRKRRKDDLVRATGRLAIAGLGFLMLAVLGAALLVVDLVEGRATGIVVCVVLAAIFSLLWVVIPLRVRSRTEDDAPNTRSVNRQVTARRRRRGGRADRGW